MPTPSRTARLEARISPDALVVDAGGDGAEALYRHHGFTPFGAIPRQPVLSLAYIRPMA